MRIAGDDGPGRRGRTNERAGGRGLWFSVQSIASALRCYGKGWFIENYNFVSSALSNTLIPTFHFDFHSHFARSTSW